MNGVSSMQVTFMINNSINSLRVTINRQFDSLEKRIQHLEKLLNVKAMPEQEIDDDKSM
ncbi:hypothetical protein ABLB69_07890 [Xenorhabdus khoisanae]|uniref:hypothetical protein n=1 Tax=Xenorhabdus khoisanae TaxID=880157 RepID=UPI0032B7692A